MTLVNPSITRKYGGEGLGLVICRKLAEMTGGGITAFSEKNKGSEFTLTIPVELNQTKQLASNKNTQVIKQNIPVAGMNI
ncbi:ATP-binding protein [Pedobacter jamesrossensis]|uniref:histidine kinase n=1 Tax=Pedobacter jamesrossensis TaxID=1908238 RepID=A0ABV8NLJ9_9SPHI